MSIPSDLKYVCKGKWDDGVYYSPSTNTAYEKKGDNYWEIKGIKIENLKIPNRHVYLTSNYESTDAKILDVQLKHLGITGYVMTKFKHRSQKFTYYMEIIDEADAAAFNLYMADKISNEMNSAGYYIPYMDIHKDQFAQSKPFKFRISKRRI